MTRDRSRSTLQCASTRTLPQEVYGFVIEDFGGMSGEAVDIGEHHIVDAARRWAVQLADGSLVFVDDADIVSID